MKKKFIAFLCAISSVMSLTIAVQAKSTDIINDNFDDGNVNDYVSNLGNEGSINSDSGTLLHQHNHSGWDENAGIKKEITDELKNNNLKKGDTLTVSVDIYCGWYDGTATASLKIDGMNDITLGQVIPEQGNNVDRTITLEGSVTVEQDIPESYSNAYFVVTQPCGYVKYDNIKLTLAQDDGDTPVDPVDPPTGEWTKVLDTTGMDYETLSGLFTDGTISHYGDESNFPSADQYGYDGKPCILGHSDWNKNSGFKVDISDDVKKGDSVKATFKLKTTYEGGATEVSLLENGKALDAMYTSASTADQNWHDIETNSCDVTVDNNGNIYLYITNQAGRFYVADLVISVKGGADKPAPVFSYKPAEFEGTLEGATLTDNLVLEKGDEKVTAYECKYTGPATKGLDVTVTSGGANAGAQITTTIADNSPVVFYVVTNRASVDQITATSID